jgi:hypothetical protein
MRQASMVQPPYDTQGRLCVTPRAPVFYVVNRATSSQRAWFTMCDAFRDFSFIHCRLAGIFGSVLLLRPMSFARRGETNLVS